MAASSFIIKRAMLKHPLCQTTFPPTSSLAHRRSLADYHTELFLPAININLSPLFSDACIWLHLSMVVIRRPRAANVDIEPGACIIYNYLHSQSQNPGPRNCRRRRLARIISTPNTDDLSVYSPHFHFRRWLLCNAVSVGFIADRKHVSTKKNQHRPTTIVQRHN